MVAAPTRSGTASWSRSTSPTSGSTAWMGAVRRGRSRPRAAARLRYADLELDPAGNRVFAVREDHRSGGEPVNSIVVLDLDGRDDPGRVLAAGHDFFSSPRLSPDRRQLAWLSWDHPNMPWDGTELWLAEIGADARLAAARGGSPADRGSRSCSRPGRPTAGSISSPIGPAGGTSTGSAKPGRFPSARCLPNSAGRPGASAAAGTASSMPTPSLPASPRPAAGIWRGSSSRAAV